MVRNLHSLNDNAVKDLDIRNINLKMIDFEIGKIYIGGYQLTQKGRPHGDLRLQV